VRVSIRAREICSHRDAERVIFGPGGSAAGPKPGRDGFSVKLGRLHGDYSDIRLRDTSPDHDRSFDTNTAYLQTSVGRVNAATPTDTGYALECMMRKTPTCSLVLNQRAFGPLDCLHYLTLEVL
jgi:hypothetical protein